MGTSGREHIPGAAFFLWMLDKRCFQNLWVLLFCIRKIYCTLCDVSLDCPLVPGQSSFCCQSHGVQCVIQHTPCHNEMASAAALCWVTYSIQVDLHNRQIFCSMDSEARSKSMICPSHAGQSSRVSCAQAKPVIWNLLVGGNQCTPLDATAHSWWRGP